MLIKKQFYFYISLCGCLCGAALFASTASVLPGTPSDDTLPQSLNTAILQAQTTYIQNHLPPSPVAPLQYTCTGEDTFCNAQATAWANFLQSYNATNAMANLNGGTP